MRRLGLSICILLWIKFCEAQIINTENSRIQSDTTGWLGTAGTTFSLIKNVQEVISIDASVHLQYKSVKDLYLFLGNFNLLRGNNQQLTNNMFYHLRYNRKINDIVRWELFTQWQQNIVTNIELRALVGTGPRLRLRDIEKFKFYVGVLAMYEYERDRKPTTVHKDVRSDNYLSFTYLPNSIFSITSTTFYQPLFNDPDDFRLLNQLSLTIKATRHFSIITNWSYLYDTRPAPGTPKVNLSISNGFTYTF